MGDVSFYCLERKKDFLIPFFSLSLEKSLNELSLSVLSPKGFDYFLIEYLHFKTHFII